MFARSVLTVLLCGLTAGAGAATYTVTSALSSGVGTLRWAINQANANAGPHLITFSAGLAGAPIQPTVALPTITRADVSLDGDLNDDGKPDVWLEGALQPAGSGLVTEGNGTIVTGLAVTGFRKYGLVLLAADGCTVRSCHLGVSLDSTQALPNREADLALWQADQNTIGGSAPTSHNVLAGGSTASMGTAAGIYVVNSHYNQIYGNFIGVQRNGVVALDSPGVVGILLSVEAAFSPSAATTTADAPAVMTCSNNTIGSTDPARRNVIARVHIGIQLQTAEGNTILGNFLGLGKDGAVSLPLQSTGLLAIQGAANNLIGGTTGAARNVFSAHEFGAKFEDPGTIANRLYGNYFGLNATGTQQRLLAEGVRVSDDAGAQTIGGNTTAHRNYFTPNASTETTGVSLATAGNGTVIRNNRFGVRPDGNHAADLMDYAVTVGNVQATITDNLIARAIAGLDVGGPSGNARAYANTFRLCQRAVRITNLARCSLGDLGNADATDDGSNTFATTNTWHVDNRTGSRVPAEGNSWGTNVAAQIDAKLYDKLDNASYGRVDYAPLKNGVQPTGATESVAVALTGAVAHPTARGAEIAFTLSAPARVTVEVLNLAGRPVALLPEHRAAAPGLQRLVWTGRTRQGLPAPAGAYLLRLTAHDDAGRQVTALTPLRLER